ncbi:MAG: LamG domain-containing protein [Victivallales bacterium]|nr:LamG domain-containing protein [Victivallales bacterium]
MRSMRIVAVSLLLALLLCGKDILQADFTKESSFRLFDGAQLKDKCLVLQGKKSYAEVVGSERFKVGQGGLTISCIAAFDKLPKLGQDLFWKEESWMLSRFDGGAMTAYLHDGLKYVARSDGGFAAEPGTFNHYALTIRRFVQAEEGKYGYIIEIYINGELEARTENFGFTLNEPSNPVTLGRGNAGDVWAMNGKIAFFRMEDRALSQEELYEEAKKSGLVKVKQSRYREIGAGLKAALEALPQGLPEREWLVGAFSRAASNGADQEAMAAAVGRMKGVSAKSLEEAADKINAAQDMLRLMVGKRAALCYVVKDCGSAFPLCGMYDRKSRREVFGRQTMDFRLKTAIGKKRSGYTATESNWPKKEVAISGNQVTMTFQNKAALVTLKQVFDGNARLESHVAVQMLDNKQLLQEVVFPHTMFARLDRGRDKMVYPWQEGVIVEEPTLKNHPRVRQSMFYPRSYLSMQFGAYYDDASGIYFAFEDPEAEIKQYYAQGQKGELVAMWTGFAPWKAGDTGGNSYNMSGVSAIELYDGEWFEATRVYRRFLESKARWWVKDIPRKDTQKRFRDLPMWIQVHSNHQVYKKPFDMLAAELKYFRDYLELPFGVHHYGWDDTTRHDWPHFLPKADFGDFLKDLAEKPDIYDKPYVDARLWAVKDGRPGNFDYMFSSHGEKFAVKNLDGTMNYENYRDARDPKAEMKAYAIMCPGALGWQEFVAGMANRVIGYGVPALYLDEIAAARPYLCYDTNHDHLVGDPRTWIAGHRKFMADIRGKRPGAFLDCEDGAEAFLDMLDGMMIWRWHGVVPIFNAIYHGRIQFTGRDFSLPYGDYRVEKHRQFFVKTAVQLVGAEQLGWFMMFEMQFPQRMLFIKKMSHVRNMLLEYFNEGEMLAPVSYIRHPGTDGCKWGRKFGDYVQMDKVLSGIYQRRDGVAAAIFVNPYGEKADFEPDFSRYGKKVVAVLGEKGQMPGAKITLEAESAAIVVLADKVDANAKKEADRIGKYMLRIGGFKPGMYPTDAVKLSMSKSKAPFNPMTPVCFANASAMLDANASADGTFVGWLREKPAFAFNPVTPVTEKVRCVISLYGVRGNGKMKMMQGGRELASFDIAQGMDQVECRNAFTLGEGPVLFTSDGNWNGKLLSWQIVKE